ncbi:hypothetical protein I4U23_027381 [Adineta vaga]|nr:hypothetical protein I4U23_027381 [Adineta vaga]
MKVSVKTLDNFIMSFEVKPSDSIETLKIQIENMIGLPPYRQRIIYRGQHLDSLRTFNDYNIEDGSVIHTTIQIKDFNLQKSS